ncbi:MAG: abscisic acid-deficient protein Aba4 family protein, partial [Lentimonas sp.]
TFILIAVMTAPVWIGMIFFSESTMLRRIARPFLVTPFYCAVLFVLIWKAYDASILPAPIVNATYESARDFSDHPITFLVLFCNFQILNLFLGTMLFQQAIKRGFRVPVELALCCFLGAFALVPFSVRLLIRGESLS